MKLAEIWSDGTGQLSFMRVAITPAAIALTVTIILSAIKGDSSGILASASGLCALLGAKAVQSFAEVKERRNDK
jgi:hypothetical protein